MHCCPIQVIYTAENENLEQVAIYDPKNMHEEMDWILMVNI